MASYRLYFEDDTRLTSLNLYSRQLDAFDDVSEAIGLLMATHGALAVSAATAQERSMNLNRALESNREIGVAVGIMMANGGLTRAEAFALLRVASQRANRKLIDIATEVGDTGALNYPTPAPRLRSKPNHASWRDQHSPHS